MVQFEQFDPLQHKRRAMWEALRALKEKDGYPFKLLSDVARCPRQTFYTYVPEDFDASKVVPGDAWEILKDRLAHEYQNYRLFYVSLPEGDEIVRRQGVPDANGLQDEQDDLTMATGQLTAAKIAHCASELEAVIETLEGVLPRLRRELSAMREREARRPETYRTGACTGACTGARTGGSHTGIPGEGGDGAGTGSAIVRPRAAGEGRR